MLLPTEVAVPDGSDIVGAYWSNGIIAVTPHIGSEFPGGASMDVVEGHWTLTHLRTGYALSGLIPGGSSADPAPLCALAEALTVAAPWAPWAPWATLDVERAMGDEELRGRIVSAARAFWESRERGGER